MDTKKTAKTKQAGRKGTTKRNAGKAAKAEAFKVPRTAKQLAAGIQARMKRSPEYWREVVAAMSATQDRAAQVTPRENGAGATH